MNDELVSYQDGLSLPTLMTLEDSNDKIRYIDLSNDPIFAKKVKMTLHPDYNHRGIRVDLTVKKMIFLEYSISQI